MIVTLSNCRDCPVYYEQDSDTLRQNMIDNDICPKRNMIGCHKEVNNIETPKESIKEEIDTELTMQL